MYSTVDFITKLLFVAEKNTILVVCNKLSKIVYFLATTEKTSAKRLVKLFRDSMWKLHELPDVRNRPATELVMLKVHNVKLSFDIWLVLYMYFILYS